MSEKEEKWPTAPVPYHSTTKRDGWQVPAAQTAIGAGIPALAPLTLIPLIAFGIGQWGGGLPMEWAFYAYLGLVIALALFIILALIQWPAHRDRWTDIVDRGLTPPGDLNNNGIPDWMEEGFVGLFQDSNGDGVPDIVDFLNKYNGGSATLFVNVNYNNGEGSDQDTLPFGERLPELARGIDPDKPLTYRAWGFGKKNGCLFEPPEWAKLSGALVAQGYAEKQNPNLATSSIILTEEKGRAWREALIDQGNRIEEDTGRKSPTYTSHFMRPNHSPTAAD